MEGSLTPGSAGRVGCWALGCVPVTGGTRAPGSRAKNKSASKVHLRGRAQTLSHKPCYTLMMTLGYKSPDMQIFPNPKTKINSSVKTKIPGKIKVWLCHSLLKTFLALHSLLGIRSSVLESTQGSVIQPLHCQFLLRLLFFLLLCCALTCRIICRTQIYCVALHLYYRMPSSSSLGTLHTF